MDHSPCFASLHRLQARLGAPGDHRDFEQEVREENCHPVAGGALICYGSEHEVVLGWDSGLPWRGLGGLARPLN